MNADAENSGLTADRLSAIYAGLQSMDCPPVPLHFTSDFASTVNDLLGSNGYSTTRGGGVVAGKTVLTSDGPEIVFNTETLRDAEVEVVERLGAHEAGHVHLHVNGNAFVGKQYLASTEWEWRLLCIGGTAIEEYRIERELANLGYPAAGAGTAEYVSDALTNLNFEITEALFDPESAEARHLSEQVLRTHDWTSKMFSYAAAYSDPEFAAEVKSFSAHSRRHWDDYIGRNWDDRVRLYSRVAGARESLPIGNLDKLLLDAIPIEAGFLERLGFRYSGESTSYRFDRIVSDDDCTSRLDVARFEFASGQYPDSPA